MSQMKPELAPRLRALLEQEYPRFSDAEYWRRRQALANVIAKHGVDYLLVCGEQRTGSGVQWVTGWPITTEGLVLIAPNERPLMFMEWYNHWPQAKRLVHDTDVRWGEHQGVRQTIEELRRRGAKRVGFMGLLNYFKCRPLAEAFELVDLNAEYVRLRLVKSAEEIDWLRIGAYFSDLGYLALLEGVRPGLSERELGNLVERAYVGLGGTTLIHFIGVTPMASPNLQVPPQFHSSRRGRAGDLVFCELSACFWDYPGQVLRTFTVGAEPTPLFRELHGVAQMAFEAICAQLRPGATPQELVEASAYIEQAGFTTCDDIVHGFGGGYFPPVLGSQSRPAGSIPDMKLEVGMTLVVQPNVITHDEQAGVQLGELMLITPDGCEALHRAPRSLMRAG